MPSPILRPWQVIIAFPSGLQRTIEPIARNRAHAILSALELAGMSPSAIVVSCQELGDW
jgi:hypothetical protein